ncbi:MAG: hypothetical protein E7255_13665 [Lachnospiraceae bacterium]|nr:hypothetical protein [Lachnospiraceae bacterium]
MSRNQKVVKFRKRKSLNIGIAVFLVIFIYIIINIYIYLTKNHISIYEVHEGTTAQDNRITGLILRKEKVITSDGAGYISYFQKEGARVSKNSSVYAVDESRQIVDVILSGDVPITLSKKNNAEIKYEIMSFQKNYSKSDFSAVYNFKEEADNLVLDLLNTTMLDHGHTIQEDTGLDYSYQMYKSKASGVISYYVDNYETVTENTISSDLFQRDNYDRTSLRTTTMLPPNSPVYKIITSDQWSLLLPLKKEQYAGLQEKETIKFTIRKDDVDAKAKISLLQKGSEFYAKLTMDKYMTNYLNDRFLEVDLKINGVEGLKIPKTSIVEKNFYMVPLEYFTEGGDSGKSGLIVEQYSKNGEVSYQFVPVDIYYEDEIYGYVDTEMFEVGTGIVSDGNMDRFTLTQMNKLTGVYCVNTGYSVFKRIEVLYEDKEYCIIEKNTLSGLSAYDHIALDGSTAVDQAIIY